MHAEVNADMCTGCGLCVDICPEVFELKGDAAVATEDAVPEDNEETCQEAAESCPVEAISITED